MLCRFEIVGVPGDLDVDLADWTLPRCASVKRIARIIHEVARSLEPAARVDLVAIPDFDGLVFFEGDRFCVVPGGAMFALEGCFDFLSVDPGFERF